MQSKSPIEELQAVEHEAGSLARRRLDIIRRLDLSRDWDYGECRDVVHWIASHCQISWIDAKRRVDAAHAIEALPVVAAALESGELSLDKTVQLTRFATADTEGKLVKWAKSVSLKAVRDRADEALRRDLDDVCNDDLMRNFGWRKIEDGAGYSFYGALPAEQGAVVIKAIDRLAERVPELPHEEIDGLLTPERGETLPQRRADALVLASSRQLVGDGDANRSTVIVHAPLASLAADDGCCLLEDGTPLHPETVRRLTCDARIKTVIEDGKGEPIGIGRADRDVPPWLKKLVVHRDRTCTFPGCSDTLFTEAHHVWHWTKGGPTDLDNLILVCGFHHKAVHEYGWSVTRAPNGVITWFRPSGRVHGVRLPHPREGVPDETAAAREPEPIQV